MRFQASLLLSLASLLTFVAGEETVAAKPRSTYLPPDLEIGRKIPTHPHYRKRGPDE